MHPYITQLLMNERVAEMHRNATADRRVRRARSRGKFAARAAALRRPALPVAKLPSQATLGSTSPSAQVARHSLHGRGTGLAVVTRPDQDIAADDRALCGICDDR